jgi:hypothetical protein
MTVVPGGTEIRGVERTVCTLLVSSEGRQILWIHV